MAATTETTYSMLYVPFIHAILNNNRATQMNEWWGSIFGQEWSDLIRQYRERIPWQTLRTTVAITQHGYIQDTEQDRILDMDQVLRMELYLMIQRMQGNQMDPAQVAELRAAAAGGGLLTRAEAESAEAYAAHQRAAAAANVSPPMITCLEDAEFHFGPLEYNDEETVQADGGVDPDWTDSDGRVRWAGIPYEMEEADPPDPAAECEPEPEPEPEPQVD